jgi:hypothetical protein
LGGSTGASSSFWTISVTGFARRLTDTTESSEDDEVVELALEEERVCATL